MEWGVERSDCLTIRNDLKRHMYNSDDKPRRFLIPNLVKKVWQNYDVGDLPEFQDCTQDELNIIKEHYLQVLSIAIFSKWPYLMNFLAVFVANALTDNKIPFTKEDLVPLKTWKEEFFKHQFAFKPTTIEQSITLGYVQEVPDFHRLPFIGQSDVDHGAFGAVTKRLIAPECLVSQTEDDVPKYNRDVCVECFPSSPY